MGLLHCSISLLMESLPELRRWSSTGRCTGVVGSEEVMIEAEKEAGLEQLVDQ